MNFAEYLTQATEFTVTVSSTSEGFTKEVPLITVKKKGAKTGEQFTLHGRVALHHDTSQDR